MPDLVASTDIDLLLQAADFPAAKTSQGLGTGDSPQFTAVNVGAATDTTITRVSAGVIAVEGSTVVVQGGALGTPASGTGTNLTGIPIASGISGLGTGVATALAVANNAAGGYSPIDGTATLTNKRVTARITTITSNATPTVNTDNCDCVTITAQAAAITSMTTNLTGTPVNFDQLEYRIKDDGTARAITWGASFVAGPTALPTTTIISKALHVFFEYDSVQAKFVCMSSGSDA